MPGLQKGTSGSPALVLSCPAAGSANPSTSLASLWNYLLPALQHIMRPSIESGGEAGKVDPEYHVLIHTAVYNYFLSQNQAKDRVFTGSPSGHDLYQYLESYFSGVAKEILRAAPAEENLAIYLVERFESYRAGAQSINRLLNYMNRHFVKRSVDEDRGWLRITDLIDGLLNDLHDLQSQEKVAGRLRDHRANELEKWGYTTGGSPEQAAEAEASAEAASPPDRIIPIASLAFRRFRIEVLEPLLAIPKSKGGKRRKSGFTSPVGPKGRLARSVKTLVEGKTGCPSDKKAVASSLIGCFQRTGVRLDHPLRKCLTTFTHRQS